MPLFRIMVGWLLALSAFALDPSVQITQYAKRHWQVEDGLPQNYVTDISQAPNGTLLVATSGGVARFDGVRFTPILIDQQTGISREWVNVVRATADGAVWIGTRDAGLYRNRAGRTEQQAGGRQSTTSMMVARDGRLLAIEADGLVEHEGTSRRLLDGGVRGLDLAWNSLIELRDGSVLVATSRGTKRYAQGVMRRLPEPAAGGLAFCYAASRGGGVWMGTEHGLYRARSEKLDAVTPVAGVPGPVVSVVEDWDGVVWAGTWGRGLYRVHGNEVVSYTYKDGLSDDFVHSLLEDSEGNLWIGSRAGLSRWKSGPLVTFGPPEGLNAQFISAVSGDAAGSVYFGSWRSGLFQARGGVVKKVALPEPDMTLLIRAVAVAPGGGVWVAGYHGGLYAEAGGRWRRLTEAEPGFGPRIEALAFDRAGTLWATCARGVYAFEGGSLQAGAPRIRRADARALLAARDGTIWAGWGSRLVRLRGGVLEEIAGLPHPAVRSISEDEAGRVWVTTRANGISRIAGGAVRNYDQRQGLPPLPFYAAVDDGIGSLWLASPTGIYQVPLKQFDEMDSGSRARLDPVPYGQDDGMRAIECQGDSYQPAWKDAAGLLWFATVKGVVRVNPRSARVLPPATVVIEAVESSAAGHLVRYSAPRLSAPGRVEFRYRIDDNPEWVFAGADRDLRYGALAPGRHRLSIAAREAGGAWGEAAAVELVQTPRVYQTWWFRLLMVLAAAGVTALAYRWRVVILKGRYRAVLAERNRIAREWHDTLLAGFSAISWQLDTTLKRLRTNPESAVETVEVARNMLQHYRVEARRVIWDLRREEPEPESLAAAVGRALGELLRGREVAHSVEVEGRPCALAPELAQNLLRICQEASANAVSHAAPSRIDVRLRFDASSVSVSVQDDGVGFDPSRVAYGHFGLEIMRERASRFGGELSIDTAPGRGCTITVKVPRPEATS